MKTQARMIPGRAPVKRNPWPTAARVLLVVFTLAVLCAVMPW